MHVFYSKNCSHILKQKKQIHILRFFFFIFSFIFGEKRKAEVNTSKRRLGRDGMVNRQVKDDFFVGETMGERKHASDSLSRSSFPTPRETGRDR